MPGTMTLADFRTATESGLQRANVGNTLLDRWINQALQEFAYKFKFHELEGRQEFDLVDGAYSYVLDSGISDFRALSEEGLWIVSPSSRVRKLIPESRLTWLREVDIHNTSARGWAKWYHKYGNCLFFRPVPDATVTRVQLHYWKTTSLVNPTDVQPFASDWDPVVLTGAIAQGLQHFGELERFFNMRADFFGRIRSRGSQEDLEEFPEGGISAAFNEQDLTGDRSGMFQ